MAWDGHEDRYPENLYCQLVRTLSVEQILMGICGSSEKFVEEPKKAKKKKEEKRRRQKSDSSNEEQIDNKMDTSKNSESSEKLTPNAPPNENEENGCIIPREKEIYTPPKISDTNPFLTTKNINTYVMERCEGNPRKSLEMMSKLQGNMRENVTNQLLNHTYFSTLPKLKKMFLGTYKLQLEHFRVDLIDELVIGVQYKDYSNNELSASKLKEEITVSRNDFHPFFDEMLFKQGFVLEVEKSGIKMPDFVGESKYLVLLPVLERMSKNLNTTKDFVWVPSYLLICSIEEELEDLEMDLLRRRIERLDEQFIGMLLKYFLLAISEARVADLLFKVRSKENPQCSDPLFSVSQFFFKPKHEGNLPSEDGTCANCENEKTMNCPKCGFTTFCSDSCMKAFEGEHSTKKDTFFTPCGAILLRCTAASKKFGGVSKIPPYSYCKLSGDISFDFGVMPFARNCYEWCLEEPDLPKEDVPFVIFKVFLSEFYEMDYESASKSLTRLLKASPNFLEDLNSLEGQEANLGSIRARYKIFNFMDIARIFFRFIIKWRAVEKMKEKKYEEALQCLSEAKKLKLSEDGKLEKYRMQCLLYLGKGLEFRDSYKKFHMEQNMSFGLENDVVGEDRKKRTQSMLDMIDFVYGKGGSISDAERLFMLDTIEGVDRVIFRSMEGRAKHVEFYQNLLNVDKKLLTNKERELMEEFYFCKETGADPVLNYLRPDVLRFGEDIEREFKLDHILYFYRDKEEQSKMRTERKRIEIEGLKLYEKTRKEFSKMKDRFGPFLENRMLLEFSEHEKRCERNLRWTFNESGIYDKIKSFSDLGILVTSFIDAGAYGFTFKCVVSSLLTGKEDQQKLPKLFDLEVLVLKIMIPPRKERLNEGYLLDIFKKEYIELPYHPNVVSVYPLGKEKVDFEIDIDDYLMGYQMKNRIRTLLKRHKKRTGKQHLSGGIMLMPFYKKDLKMYINQNHSKGKTIGEFELSAILMGIFRGCYHLHKNRIVHRDLHPGNIFIDEVFGRVWVGDFGFCLHLQDNPTGFKVNVNDPRLRSFLDEEKLVKGGSVYFLPPEINDFEEPEKEDEEETEGEVEER